MNNEFKQSVNYKQDVIDLTRVPSIMAEHPSNRVGEHYEFIPTMRVANVLKEENWLPVKAYEVHVRNESRLGFQKHLIRFRHSGTEVQNVGDLFPEIVLTNAHDGTAAFVFMYGIFKLACLNGLVVADSLFETIKVRHQGFQNRYVIRAAREISENTPKIMNRVHEFKQIELSVPEQLVFAEQALTVKYDEEQAKNFNYERLMLPLRTEDALDKQANHLGTNSLWNTYNIVQEKLVEKGGRFQKKVNPETGRIIGLKNARPITAITENVRLNRALWALTEKMAELKH